MLQKLEQAIKLAEAYRREEGQDGGIVLVYAGQVYGWKNELRDPQSERPGALAVSADGRVWLAVGGNDQDGAKSWSLHTGPARAAPTASLAICCPRHPAQQSFIVPSKKGGLLQ